MSTTQVETDEQRAQREYMDEEDRQIAAARIERDTYKFVGFEAEEMADLAADINAWLVNHPGWWVKSTQHSSYSVAIDEQILYGFSALLEVSRS